MTGDFLQAAHHHLVKRQHQIAREQHKKQADGELGHQRCVQAHDAGLQLAVEPRHDLQGQCDLLVDGGIAQREIGGGIAGQFRTHDLFRDRSPEGIRRGVCRRHVHVAGDVRKNGDAGLVGGLDILVEIVLDRNALAHQFASCRCQFLVSEDEVAEAAQLRGVFILHRPAQHRDIHHVIGVEVRIQAQLRAIGHARQQVQRQCDVVGVQLEGRIRISRQRRLQQGLMRLEQQREGFFSAEVLAQFGLARLDFVEGGADSGLLLRHLRRIAGRYPSPALSRLDQIDQRVHVSQSLQFGTRKHDLVIGSRPQVEQGHQ
ncbi:hypothetical protein IMCC9480_2870 [Oxalobacteraceae bacterium IMCC9480]|nr:hypothetical protein IMCC9480_2870 [Oxalobacteraceae bacterium IMCC9480]